MKCNNAMDLYDKYDNNRVETHMAGEDAGFAVHCHGDNPVPGLPENGTSTLTAQYPLMEQKRDQHGGREMGGSSKGEREE